MAGGLPKVKLAVVLSVFQMVFNFVVVVTKLQHTLYDDHIVTHEIDGLQSSLEKGAELLYLRGGQDHDADPMSADGRQDILLLDAYIAALIGILGDEVGLEKFQLIDGDLYEIKKYPRRDNFIV